MNKSDTSYTSQVRSILGSIEVMDIGDSEATTCAYSTAYDYSTDSKQLLLFPDKVMYIRKLVSVVAL